MNKRNILFYPFSVIYGLITATRNFLYNTGILRSEEFPFPVICVGNITVGGTGKTPHTQYLATLLEHSYNVAILSRGYKRKSKGFRVADTSSTSEEIGDEPLQIYNNVPGAVVAVDGNRVRGVKNILKSFPDREVIILDDGFQHRRITPGFSILLSDYDRLFFRDHMLPYGNLREQKENMRRADIILITKTPDEISAIQRRLIVKEIDKSSYQNLFFTSLRYKAPVALFAKSANDPNRDLSDGQECGIVLLTGIANPKPLMEHLGKRYSEIVPLAFPDHHNYTEKDLQKISLAYSNLKSPKRYLITTEKDAVRLREFTNIAEPLQSAFYYIPIDIHFLNEDKDEFDNLIFDYVRKNHRDNRISEGQRNS